MKSATGLTTKHRWLTIAALTTFGLGAFAAPAFADDPIDDGTALIDTTTDFGYGAGNGGLVITKLLGPASTTQSDGTVQTPSSTTPVPGIIFNITKVQAWSGACPTLDSTSSIIGSLTTSANWAAASALATAYNASLAANSTLPNMCKDTSSTTCTTGSDGVCRVGGSATATSGTDVALPFGLYYVTEDDSSALAQGVTPSEPFFVTVPITNPVNLSDQSGGDRWLYQVNVYPKNNHVGVTKTVTSTAVTQGQPLVYQIVADVPTNTIVNQTGEDVVDITGYAIKDNLDPQVDLAAITSTPAPVTVTLLGASGAEDSLTSSDYTITATQDGTTTAVTTFPAAGPTVNVVFTPTGLAKLMAQAQLFVDDTATPKTTVAPQVVVTINTTVNVTLDTDGTGNATAAPGDVVDGIIPNQAALYPDSTSVSSMTNTPGIPSNPVQTNYGGVMLHKYDGTNPTTPLPDATFQVFATAANAAALTSPLTAQDIDLAPTTNFITNTDGEVAILGLNYVTDNTYQSDGTTVVVDDDENPVVGPTCYIPATGAIVYSDVPLLASTIPVTAEAGTTYWVVETEAPLGYELQTTPFQICLVGVLDGDTAGDSQDDFHVANYPHNAGFEMPLTGLFGDNVWAFYGLVVVAAGIGFYIVRERFGKATV